MIILYLEQYVSFFNYNQKRVLFYNHINGKSIDYITEAEVTSYLRHCYNNCFILDDSILNNCSMKKIIQSLEQNIMGRLIHGEEISVLPAKVTPYDISNNIELQQTVFGGDKSKNKLTNLTLHLDSLDINLSNEYSTVLHQFPFLLKKSKSNYFLTVNNLKEKIFETNFPNLSQLDIILNEPSLLSKSIIEISNSKSIICNYYVLFSNFLSSFNKWVGLINNNLHIVLFNDFNNSIEFLDKHNVLSFATLILLIKNEVELNEVQNVLYMFPYLKYLIFPYFSNNIEFFEEYVFTDISSLENTPVSKLDLIKNSYINNSFYGKLVLDYNGNLYSNINAKPLGNIFIDNIPYLINIELSSNNSWLLTRNKVQPCKDCNYNQICPPISNYEIYTNRFNLCNIHKNM